MKIDEILLNKCKEFLKIHGTLSHSFLMRKLQISWELSDSILKHLNVIVT
jgi:hypothetical protein